MILVISSSFSELGILAVTFESLVITIDLCQLLLFETHRFKHFSKVGDFLDAGAQRPILVFQARSFNRLEGMRPCLNHGH